MRYKRQVDECELRKEYGISEVLVGTLYVKISAVKNDHIQLSYTSNVQKGQFSQNTYNFNIKEGGTIEVPLSKIFNESFWDVEYKVIDIDEDKNTIVLELVTLGGWEVSELIDAKD